MRDELLTAAAALLGWALLTWAGAQLWSPLAWAISGGLLLLSLAGWRLLAVVVWEGLYALTRDDEEEQDSE